MILFHILMNYKNFAKTNLQYRLWKKYFEPVLNEDWFAKEAQQS